jgi:methylphosphotriester-DNA--protein-cysteine methyltransferase
MPLTYTNRHREIHYFRSAARKVNVDNDFIAAVKELGVECEAN